MIAAYVSYLEGEKHAHLALSHISGEGVMMVVMVCAAILLWSFRKGK
ncbi:hypothetical protein [Pedosphaera parvula]|uniref:Uncharacterized protein n=1 Tax=Pedosphaera parvula (strain Ellin514) TaxID=320771 RepID=B9XHV7_PEDPL|nr:hypothetical protein [Pedosphaera parvula]EEF60685.1 hypothetical protein Cflav_PD6276 [Pedosphaera parvula Ellin514]